MTHILKESVDVMSTVVETSRIPLLEIPRRFTFSEVAHARHNSSKLDSALTYSQHCLYLDDIAGPTSILLLLSKLTALGAVVSLRNYE